MSISNSVKSLLRPALIELSLLLNRSYAEPPKILVLYLYADKCRYPNTLPSLRNLLRHLGDVRLVAINNFGTEEGERQLDGGGIEISGDNEYWEFSGWKKGLEYASAKYGDEMDFVLFVNDAFLNMSSQGKDIHYYKKRFNRMSIQKFGCHAMGDISWVKERQEINGIQVNRWIKSSIYCTSYQDASRLKFVYLTDDQIESIVPKVPQTGRLILPNDILCDNLRLFLEDWLLRQWQWRVTLSDQSWSLLRSKVTAIINERLVSADLISQGRKLKDINRL